MIEAAHELGTENLLTIAGSTYIPWLPEREPVPIDVCDRRAREAIGSASAPRRKNGVSLNIENIFFNGYLTTPDEMNAFVDSFGQQARRVHFDTGNVMLFQFPEHWIPVLGRRIRNVHFKEFSKKGTGPYPRLVPDLAGRHHQLAGRHGSARRRPATQAISRSSTFIRSYTIPRPSSIRPPTPRSDSGCKS